MQLAGVSSHQVIWLGDGKQGPSWAWPAVLAVRAVLAVVTVVCLARLRFIADEVEVRCSDAAHTACWVACLRGRLSLAAATVVPGRCSAAI